MTDLSRAGFQQNPIALHERGDHEEQLDASEACMIEHSLLTAHPLLFPSSLPLFSFRLTFPRTDTLADAEGKRALVQILRIPHSELVRSPTLTFRIAFPSSVRYRSGRNSSGRSKMGSLESTCLRSGITAVPALMSWPCRNLLLFFPEVFQAWGASEVIGFRRIRSL